MYKIGELLSLCSISVKTLRFYDSEGILKPKFIDDFTGYRYYSASQLADCYMIVRLKELGFSLKEIKRFMEAGGDERLALLAEKEQQLARIKYEAENSINVLWKISMSLKENIDVLFEDDPEVVGKWQMIDCVPCRENFHAKYLKATDLSKAVRDLYFLPKGEKYWCFGWTRGYLLSRCGWLEKVNRNRYWMEKIDGADYLFIEFKAYEYYLGGKPELWVLKRLDHKAYTKDEIRKKDEMPELPFGAG